ncbi:galactokinase [Treponema brennaborense]|uniref:Galactokinase n=1 Tax=Treponema brennaborense (strain DSM 12168 / CIP 105900 / DD5/3) TaxID=906968 RepID=F4LMB0_TREBD|nr:galactokinase [Treponema brennaborense]AEE17776.1 Galactokinase [Treponema brennaborense DSM 12168]
MKTDYTALVAYAETDISLLKKAFGTLFESKYGTSDEEIHFYAAPARINIIGEHIDYNGGKVFPAAIDKYIYLALRRRTDATVKYDDVRFPGEFSFSITDNFTYKKENDYCNYLNGILTILKDRGFTFETGFEALFFSCIPAGGGISSSSALECCFAYAVSDLYGLGIDGVEIAKIGQESEHRFMNVNCGIMDQFIIATAKKETAILLDCATLEYQYVPLKLGDYRFVVMNTNKKRQLSDSKYNERVSECKIGLGVINAKLTSLGKKTVPDLCSLSSQDFAELQDSVKDPIILKRIRHCVTENERVYKAVAALKAGALADLGVLMNASHDSLRNDYETTGIELDTLHEEANKTAGCLGSRVTGAGFGGCAIALIHKDGYNDFVKKVGAAYKDKIGYEATFFECGTGGGAHSI